MSNPKSSMTDEEAEWLFGNDKKPENVESQI